VASSLLLAAAVTALALIPDGKVWVFVAFVALSAAGAARSSSFQAWMTELVPGRRRGSLMSLAMASGQLGMAVGAGIAGLVYARTGYAGDAGLAALVAVATAALVVLGLPETLPWASGPTQLVGGIEAQGAAQGHQGGEESGEQQDAGGEQRRAGVEGGDALAGDEAAQQTRQP
jgi:MFS family permease